MEFHEDDLKRILDKYLSGTATSSEAELLEKFFNEKKSEALREKGESAEYRLAERRVKNSIDERLFRRTNWQPMFWKVAASLTAILLIAYVFTFLQKEPVSMPVADAATLVRSTERGQKISIKLPDGTTCKLNSKSRLTFPEKFGKSSREVILEGEGFFEVTHNPSSPFIVHTQGSSTQVLGTSFNVSEKNGVGTEVTLVTGKVNITSEKTKQSIDLKPNQQALIRRSDSSIDTLSVDVSGFIEWKDNILSFDKVPLKNVVMQLQDWYGVDIEIKSKAIEGCVITARYEGESLENVLESFQFMLKGSYTLDGKNVTLSGKGCKNKK